MVGGQMLDIEGETKTLSLSELETVHINKTGALCHFVLKQVQYLQVLDEEKSAKLKDFAYHIGLAFQIQDDILDITSTTEELGKTAGSDVTSDKSTYPSLLGLEGAMSTSGRTSSICKRISCCFLKTSDPLLGLFADYIVERKS